VQKLLNKQGAHNIESSLIYLAYLITHRIDHNLSKQGQTLEEEMAKRVETVDDLVSSSILSTPTGSSSTCCAQGAGHQRGPLPPLHPQRREEPSRPHPAGLTQQAYKSAYKSEKVR